MAVATSADVAKLKEVIEPFSRVLILTHSNPDPDALAAAAALRLIINRAGKSAFMCYAGFLSRAENREMVRRLRLPVHAIEHVDLRRFRAVILVDTQPASGNNPVAANGRIVGVVDHHPLRATSRGVPFSFVDPEPGATSTIAYELLKAAEIKPPANIATALYFGIKTDTQDLGREAVGRDLAAYKELFSLANHRRLAKVMHPRRPQDYFRTVSKALDAACVYGDCIYVPIGEVKTPEYVSEIADYVINLERMRWAVASGLFKGDLYFSIRTLTARKDAGRLLRRAIGSCGVAGGHQKIAGGVARLSQLDEAKRGAARDRIVTHLLSAFGANPANCATLLAAPPAAAETAAPPPAEQPGDAAREEGARPASQGDVCAPGAGPQDAPTKLR